MATKPLTNREHQANEALKRINKKTFTKSEYETNEIAKLFLEVFDITGVFVFEVIYEGKVPQNDLERKILLNHQNIEKRDLLHKNHKVDKSEHVGFIFDITNKQLISELLCDEYEESYSGHYCSQCKKTFLYQDEIRKKVDNWFDYCLSIKDTVNTIKILFPDWSTMKAKNKKEHILNLKKMMDLPLYKNSKKDLFRAIEFLENYTLNQANKIMAEKLLTRQLPKIDNYEIALKITNNTNFGKFRSKAQLGDSIPLTPGTDEFNNFRAAILSMDKNSEMYEKIKEKFSKIIPYTFD